MQIAWHENKRLSNALRHPGCPAVISVLGIIAAVLGGFWTDEIKNSFPFYFQFYPPYSWSWHATLFWSSVLFAGLLFYLRQKTDDIERKRAQDELVAQAELLRKLVIDEDKRLGDAQNELMNQARKLEDQVRTLPPANFLENCAKLYQSADIAALAALGTPEPPTDKRRVDQAIRIVLRAIARLAQCFDGDFPNAKYAANIMIYKPTSTMSQDERNEIRERLAFCEDAVSIDELEGVLDLACDLSATNEGDGDGDDVALDRILKPLAIPIPRERMDGQLHKVLPGAPHAFTANEKQSFKDPAEIKDWFSSKAAFSPTVIRRVMDYFNSNQLHIGSFVAVPVWLSSKPTQPFAVLNIHCDRPGILREQHSAGGQFVTVIRPIQIVLATLLIARQQQPTVKDVLNPVTHEPDPQELSN